MILRIRELRTGRGLTQEQVAAALGINKSIVSNWESETFLPKTRDLPEIAAVLGVSVGELFATQTTALALTDHEDEKENATHEGRTEEDPVHQGHGSAGGIPGGGDGEAVLRRDEDPARAVLRDLGDHRGRRACG